MERGLLKEFLLSFFNEKFGLLFYIKYEDISFDFVFFFRDEDKLVFFYREDDVKIIIKFIELCRREFIFNLSFFSKIRLFRIDRNESYIKWERRK